MPTFSRAERSLRKLVTDYQSLNASQIDALTTAPTPLEFSRYVGANRPVVIRKAGTIPALERWSDEYLIRAMAEKEVLISVSPNGNADSIVDGVFVEPANVPMPLSRLFSLLKAEETDPQNESTDPVYYLQSQNGNLAEEYASLRADVGEDGPEWAIEVFGESPDVANIWIGGRRSKTSMHKDPYENIYCVVRGTKTFTLLPPTEAYCVHEQLYPHATYTFTPPSSFTLEKTSPELLLPWIPVDPLNPDLDKYPRYKLARPMTVTLEKGDMLYLPALWYHQVTQTPSWGPLEPGSNLDRVGTTQAAIAVNWWYDMKMDGSFWSTMQLLRREVLALDGREEMDEDDENGGEEEEEES
ncbi:hypothetical protein JCM11641_001532 [Rhodosporidiobolus odoratus]